MDNGTLDIQAALLVKRTDLSSLKRDLEMRARMAGDEISRVNAALDALQSMAEPAQEASESTSTASPDVIGSMSWSEPVNMVEKAPLSGGGPGGFGSPGVGIRVGLETAKAKSRTPKRRQQKRTRG
jgi:hypothetical protein